MTKCPYPKKNLGSHQIMLEINQFLFKFVSLQACPIIGATQNKQSSTSNVLFVHTACFRRSDFHLLVAEVQQAYGNQSSEESIQIWWLRSKKHLGTELVRKTYKQKIPASQN